MAHAGGGAAAAGAIAAAIQATKASGVIVKLNSDDFVTLIHRMESPLIVTASGGMFKKNYQYLVSYKGLAFFTKSDEKLPLPGGTELVAAKTIWIPG